MADIKNQKHKISDKLCSLHHEIEALQTKGSSNRPNQIKKCEKLIAELSIMLETFETIIFQVEEKQDKHKSMLETLQVEFNLLREEFSNLVCVPGLTALIKLEKEIEMKLYNLSEYVDTESTRDPSYNRKCQEEMGQASSLINNYERLLGELDMNFQEERKRFLKGFQDDLKGIQAQFDLIVSVPKAGELMSLEKEINNKMLKLSWEIEDERINSLPQKFRKIKRCQRRAQKVENMLKLYETMINQLDQVNQENYRKILRNLADEFEDIKAGLNDRILVPLLLDAESQEVKLEETLALLKQEIEKLDRKDAFECEKTLKRIRELDSEMRSLEDIISVLDESGRVKHKETFEALKSRAAEEKEKAKEKIGDLEETLRSVSKTNMDMMEMSSFLENSRASYYIVRPLRYQRKELEQEAMSKSRAKPLRERSIQDNNRPPEGDRGENKGQYNNKFDYNFMKTNCEEVDGFDWIETEGAEESHALQSEKGTLSTEWARFVADRVPQIFSERKTDATRERMQAGEQNEENFVKRVLGALRSNFCRNRASRNNVI